MTQEDLKNRIMNVLHDGGGGNKDKVLLEARGFLPSAKGRKIHRRKRQRHSVFDRVLNKSPLISLDLRDVRDLCGTLPQKIIL
jgi:hypothetical protein